MTPDEIYERLGLVEPLVFRVASGHRRRQMKRANPGLTLESGRRSGKTCGTIVNALSHLSETENEVVLIVGINKANTNEMTRQAQQWASKLGLDASRIRGENPKVYGFHRGYDRRQVFVDPDAWRDMDLADAGYLKTVDPR